MKKKSTLELTAGQAAAILGLTPPAFQTWLNRKIVSFRSLKEGKRRRRVFTDAQVRLLAVIRALYALGFEPAFAASLAPAVNRHLYAHANECGFALLAPGLRGLGDEFECTTAVLDDNSRLPIPEPFGSREAVILINLPAVRAIVHRALEAVHWQESDDPSDRYALTIPLDPETGEPVGEPVALPGHDKAVAEPAEK